MAEANETARPGKRSAMPSLQSGNEALRSKVEVCPVRDGLSGEGAGNCEGEWESPSRDYWNPYGEYVEEVLDKHSEPCIISTLEADVAGIKEPVSLDAARKFQFAHFLDEDLRRLVSARSGVVHTSYMAANYGYTMKKGPAWRDLSMALLQLDACIDLVRGVLVEAREQAEDADNRKA